MSASSLHYPIRLAFFSLSYNHTTDRISSLIAFSLSLLKRSHTSQSKNSNGETEQDFQARPQKNMSLQILSNDNVNKLLHSFTKDDILALQESLADALHWYSTSSDGNNDCCSDYQPEQTTLKRKDGSTTVYLPASGITGQGVKVLNIAATSPEGTTNNNNNGRPLPVVMPSNASGGESMTSTSSSSASITTTSTSASQATTESMRNLSLRPKSEILDGTVAAPSSSTTSKGSLTLFDNEGNTVGLINAEEITAFRTA